MHIIQIFITGNIFFSNITYSTVSYSTNFSCKFENITENENALFHRESAYPILSLPPLVIQYFTLIAILCQSIDSPSAVFVLYLRLEQHLDTEKHCKRS